MLFDLPLDLALEIISVWLGRELKCLSTLDVAFCSSAQRPAFLDLISDDRGGDATVLDRFKSDVSDADPQPDDMVPELFLSFLQWLEIRVIPIQTLSVTSSALRQVAEAAFVPNLRTVSTVRCVDSIYWPVEEGLGRLIQHCPNVTALSLAVNDVFDSRVIQIFSAILKDVAIRSLSFGKHSIVHDDGVCMLALRYGKTLTDLKLTRAELSDRSINTLAKFCKKLEVLELSCATISMQTLHKLLLSCKRLWSLTLYDFTSDDDSLLELLQVPNKLEVIKVFSAVGQDSHLTAQALIDVLGACPKAIVVAIDYCIYAKSTRCSTYGVSVIPCQAAIKVLASNHIQHKPVWTRVDLWGVPHTHLTEFQRALCQRVNEVILLILDAMPSDVQEFVFGEEQVTAVLLQKLIKFKSTLRIVSGDPERCDQTAQCITELIQACPNLCHLCDVDMKKVLREAGIDHVVCRLGMRCKMCGKDV